MKLRDILFEIKNLDLYTSEEWQEYVRCFSNSDRILDYIAKRTGSCQPSKDSLKSLLLRIKETEETVPLPIDLAISDKIIDQNYLSDPRIRVGITLGIVSGCYDLLHLGHIRGMVYAKQFLGRHKRPRLCILTLSDENIRAKKGNSRPTLNINERLEMICGIDCVDYAIPLREPNCLTVLEKVKPDYFFKARKDNAQAIVKQEMDLVESYGGKIVVFPPTHRRGFSTTKIIETIIKKDKHERGF